MEKFIFTLLSTIILFTLNACQPNDQDPKDKSSIRLSLQNKVAKKVQKKHRAYGSGFGFWGPDCYEELKISFEYPSLLNQEEARYLIIDIAADFLAEVNKDEKIRPYLCQYPYTIENLNVPIFLKNNDYKTPIHPDYMLIKLFEGKITYKTKEEGQRYGYQSEETETFEEALDKLRQQDRVPDYFKDYPSSKE